MMTREHEQELLSSEKDALRRSILDSIPISIVATDGSGRIVSANRAAERLLGYYEAELVGSSLSRIDAVARTATGDWGPVLNASLGAERAWTYRRKDGAEVLVNEAITPLYGNGRGAPATGYLAVAYDINKRTQAQAKAQLLETRDELTNLPTRARLLRRLEEAIANADQDATEVVVLVVDIDHLKRINDELGRQAGDDLLQRIADRLRHWVRSTDTVARDGGDEFFIVLAGLQRADALTSRIDLLLEDLLTTIMIGGRQLAVTASIGGAVHQPAGPDAAALLERANLAMAHARASGGNNFQWYDDAMLEDD